MLPTAIIHKTNYLITINYKQLLFRLEKALLSQPKKSPLEFLVGFYNQFSYSQTLCT
jgi:hypothetical protein